MAARPALDRLHRRVVARELAAIDQHAADRAVRVTVLVRVTDPHHAAVGQFDTARSLDLEERRVDRIGDPEQDLVGEPRLAASMSARDQ